MARRNTQPQDKKPFTAGEFIKYLKQFPKDAQLNVTIVQRKGKQFFGYPVKQFTLFTDTPEPHIFMEVRQAVKVDPKRDVQPMRPQEEEQ